MADKNKEYLLLWWKLVRQLPGYREREEDKTCQLSEETSTFLATRLGGATRPGLAVVATI
ncbi:MAG TPA: hypothetical protein VFQ43_15010 [Nitrososphaera sp.]|nr:hypothetical protein [Nitrososphaera sp.]